MIKLQPELTVSAIIVIVTSISQLSVAVISVPIAGSLGIASHSTVTFVGIPASTGSVVSTVVIV